MNELFIALVQGKILYSLPDGKSKIKKKKIRLEGNGKQSPGPQILEAESGY